jgi:hypothetical protein
MTGGLKVSRASTAGGCGAQFAAALSADVLLMAAGQRLLSGSVELSTAKTYRSGLRKFECYLSTVSERLSILLPRCQSAYALVSTRGIIEGFVSFCALEGLSSKATSVYIDVLKFYVVGLEGVPTIPGILIVSRILEYPTQKDFVE